jgi:hypothetical protein
MAKKLLTLILASAIYGFAIGSVHSPLFAARNLVKFPLLILATTALCSICYYLLVRFAGVSLCFGEVQRLALELFHDTTVLLSALSPACYFLAVTTERPDLGGLGEYPLFLGINVAFIAICGSVALVRQAWVLLGRFALTLRRSLVILVGWLALSLLVGGQGAWYLRPFFGVATISGESTPFCLGTLPDFRGATSFYEAVYHLASPPPLRRGYHHKAWTDLGGRDPP